MPDINKALTYLEGSLRKTVSSARKSIKAWSCASFISESEGGVALPTCAGMPGAQKQLHVRAKSTSSLPTRVVETPCDECPAAQYPGRFSPQHDSARSSLPNDEPDSREMMELGCRMSKSLEIKDRPWSWTLCKQCFVGDEAVRWMIDEGVARDETEAIELGNRMIDLGVFHHVTEDHMFQNKPIFYRFTEAVMDDGECSPDSLPVKLMAVVEEMMRLQQRMADVQSQLRMHRKLNIALFESASEQQNQLEAVAQVLSLQVSNLELSVLSHMILLAVVLLVVLGWCGKIVGLGVLGWAAVLCYKVWFTDAQSKSKSTGMVHGDLLKRLRDTSSILDDPTPDTGDLPSRALWLRGLNVGSQEGDKTASTGDVRHANSTDNGRVSESGTPKSGFTPKFQDFQSWPDRPCILSLNTSLSRLHTSDGVDPHKIRLNTGEPFHFEGDLFEGQAVLWVAGLESSPQRLFHGQKRKTHLTIQGRFKKELKFSEVFTGQEFRRPLKHLPPTTFLSVLIRIGKKLSPSMKAGFTPIPHILTPVVAAAQMLAINKPGEERSIDSPPYEDMTILGPQLCKDNGEPLSGPQRKKLMSESRNWKGRVFDTEHVYTFQFWQHLLDLSSYELDMSIKQFSLSRHLGGQPLQLMAKTKAGEYVWNFLMWHDSLLVEY